MARRGVVRPFSFGQVAPRPCLEGDDGCPRCTERTGGEQDRLVPRQDFRPEETGLAVLEVRGKEGTRRPTRGGNAPESRSARGEHDRAVWAPACAPYLGCLADRLRDSSFNRDLHELGPGEESDPPRVRGEEGAHRALAVSNGSR